MKINNISIEKNGKLAVKPNEEGNQICILNLDKKIF